jgi:hypothetical protein
VLDEDLIEMMQREIELGYGDSRLRFILNWVKSGRPLFECDRRYLTKHFAYHTQKVTGHYEEFDRQLATTLENQVKRIQEGFGGTIEDSQDFQRSSTPEILKTSSEAILRQEKVIVEMRKNLHHILVTLDQLEERFQKNPNQTSMYEAVHHQRPTQISDIPRERSEQISDVPRAKSNERKEKTAAGHKEISKERHEIRAFAAILLIVTVVTFAAYFAVLSVVGILALKEAFSRYGITYDVIKPLLNWLVTALIICSAAWTAFGLLYLRNSKISN